jgi:hypothetical protein
MTMALRVCQLPLFQEPVKWFVGSGSLPNYIRHCSLIHACEHLFDNQPAGVIIAKGVKAVSV